MNCYIQYSDLITPLGFSLEETFEAVRAGRSGLEVHENFLYDYNPFLSIVDDKELDGRFSVQNKACSFSKLEKLSILLIQKAIAETGINPKDSKTLLIYATTKGNIDLVDNEDPRKNNTQWSLLNFKDRLKNYFGFSQDPLLVSNACVSGVQAIILGNLLLQGGGFENILVVGGDIVSRFTVSGFRALGALSDTRCKPFDKERNGTNLGEACGVILLSRREGLFKVDSSSSTLDAHHIVAPSREGSGLSKAIQNCIEMRPTGEIDFISAHGTGTVYNDEMEALAIAKNGLQKIPVFSLKGYFGHCLGAAGILETIIPTRMMMEETIIPSLGFQNTGTKSKINLTESYLRYPSKSFIKTSSGFGGVNSSIIVSKV